MAGESVAGNKTAAMRILIETMAPSRMAEGKHFQEPSRMRNPIHRFRFVIGIAVASILSGCSANYYRAETRLLRRASRGHKAE